MPPWDLTDAIDAGDTTKRSSLLARMTRPAGGIRLQLMADPAQPLRRGWPASTASTPNVEAEAADVLGIKPGFPANKALSSTAARRRRGAPGDRPAGAGRSRPARAPRTSPDDVVMDVLVARLSVASALTGRRDVARAGRQAPALTFFIRRLLRRAAWFWWMTPLAAAMSRRLTARRNVLVVVSVPMCVVAVLDAGLQLALDRLVALGPLGVGEVALLLALDVCHVQTSLAGSMQPGKATSGRALPTAR